MERRKILYTPTYFHFRLTDFALITLEEVFMDSADWSAAESDAIFLLEKVSLHIVSFRNEVVFHRVAVY